MEVAEINSFHYTAFTVVKFWLAPSSVQRDKAL
jgi:hypothetical protein